MNQRDLFTFGIAPSLACVPDRAVLRGDAPIGLVT
jgi:hypothetical protein